MQRRVTKVTLFLLLLPMTWRMIQKADSLFKKETAARRALAAASAADEAPQTASFVAKGDHHAVGITAAAAAAAASAQAGGTAPLSTAGATGALARISATLSRISATPQITDVFGPELGFLETVEDDAAFKAAPAAAAADDDDDEEQGCAGTDRQSGEQQPASSRPAAMAPRGCKAVCWQQPAVQGGQYEDAAPNIAQRIHKEETSLLPPLQVSLLALILLSTAATNIPGGFLVPCGTWQYWVVVLSPLLLMVLTWAVTRHHVLWKASWKGVLGLRDSGDLNWTSRSTVIYPAVCISAGVIAGLLGLGGGLVLTPLMLELGVNPAVSAASTQVRGVLLVAWWCEWAGAYFFSLAPPVRVACACRLIAHYQATLTTHN